MDNLNELDTRIGAQLGNKYSYTFVNGGIYYYWNKSNDKELIKPEFNWSGYLNIPEPISFKSKNTKIGYLTPRFDFISVQFNRYDYKGDQYRSVLELFGLKEESIIPPEKVPLISNYRDTLLKQLKRQEKEITKFDVQIANILKVYYYETEQATFSNLENESEKEQRIRVTNWGEILHNIKGLFQSLITKGASSELTKNHWRLKELLKNKYISEHLIDATIHGVLTLSKKKDPIIDMAVQLAHKINPLESILEDAFLNDRIKSKIQFELDERFKQLPEPESVAEKFCNREENKAGKYESEIIAKALSIVRKFIFDKELTSIKRKVRPITKEVYNNVSSLSETDLKTIDEWVKFYWNEYKPTDQTQPKH